ncbi:dihydrolipoyl dehydrogenase [candidate division WOR-3 bacterium]|nr:dihydrolipoyl dehydrogenase [candidate division WOR-3 bacterium]
MFDLTVIGGGPGGYVAALEGVRKGLKTALVEKNKVGGVCLNMGCIPTKAMLFSSSLLTLSKSGKRYGLLAEKLGFDENAADKHRSLSVAKLVKGVENLLKQRGVEVFQKEALSIEKGKVVFQDGILESKNIIMATGSVASDIPVARFDGENIISSDYAVTSHKAPSSVLVLGGGVIGVELATYWASIGVSVVIVEMFETLLPQLKDQKASMVLAESLKKKKVNVLTGKIFENCEKKNGNVLSRLKSGEEFETEKILVSTGRKPNSSIADGNILKKDSRGHLITDDYCRTSVEGILAVGDVAGEPYLAHKASHEAEVAVSYLTGGTLKKQLEYIPACVFSEPEIANIGFNPTTAAENGVESVWGEFPFSANGKAVASGTIEGWARLVARKNDHVIIGGQIVGANADLLLGEVSLAVKMGLKLENLVDTVHIHPSLCEIIPEAARAALGESLHK